MGKGVLGLWQKAKEKVKAAIFPCAEINDGRRCERNDDGGKVGERLGQRKEDVDIYRNVQGYKRPSDWDFGIVERKRKVRCHNSSAQTDFEYKVDPIPFKTPSNVKNCHDQKNKKRKKNAADEETDTKASEDLEGDEQIQRVFRKVIRKVQRKKLDLSKEGEISILAIEKTQEIIECDHFPINSIDPTEKTANKVENKSLEPKKVFEKVKTLTEIQQKLPENLNETRKTEFFQETQEIIIIEDSELPSKTSEIPDIIPSTAPSLLKPSINITLPNTLTPNAPPQTNSFVLSSHPLPNPNTSLSPIIPSTQTTQINPFLTNPPQQSSNPPDNIYYNPLNPNPSDTTPTIESNPFLNLNSVKCMQVPYKFGQNFPPNSNSPYADNASLPISPHVFIPEPQQNLFANQINPFTQQAIPKLPTNIFQVPPQNVGNSYNQVPDNYNIKSPSPAIKDIEMDMAESSKKSSFGGMEHRNQAFSSNGSREFARNVDSCTIKNTNEQVKTKSLFNNEVKSLFASPNKGENIFSSLVKCQSRYIKTPCLENVPMCTSDSPSELFSSQNSTYKTPQSQGLFDNKPSNGSNILFRSPSEDGLMSFSAQKCKDNTNPFPQNTVFGNNCFGNTEKSFATPSTVTSTPGSCEGGFSLGIVIPKNKKIPTHK